MLTLLATLFGLTLALNDARMVWPKTGSYHMVDPVFTPYYSNGTVNLEAIPTYAKLCVQKGVDVVLLGGSTGEWPSLTADERLSLLVAWRKALDTFPLKQRPQLLFHAGDVGIQAAKHLAAQSEASGADAILIVAPCIMRPATLDDLVKSIKMVADEAPNLPAVYYHYPELYGVSFSMDAFAQAATTAIATFAGIKYIDSDIETLSEATRVADGQLTFFNNDPLLAGLSVGSKGAISYTTVFPMVRKMQQAFADGNLKEARGIQHNISVYADIIAKFGGKAGARALPELFEPSLRLGEPRFPLIGLTAESASRLKESLIAAGLLKTTSEVVIM